MSVSRLVPGVWLQCAMPVRTSTRLGPCSKAQFTRTWGVMPRERASERRAGRDWASSTTPPAPGGGVAGRASSSKEFLVTRYPWVLVLCWVQCLPSCGEFLPLRSAVISSCLPLMSVLRDFGLNALRLELASSIHNILQNALCENLASHFFFSQIAVLYFVPC